MHWMHRIEEQSLQRLGETRTMYYKGTLDLCAAHRGYRVGGQAKDLSRDRDNTVAVILGSRPGRIYRADMDGVPEVLEAVSSKKWSVGRARGSSVALNKDLRSNTRRFAAQSHQNISVVVFQLDQIDTTSGNRS